MSVQAGNEKEYEDRHNPIWPELKAILKKHGVHNYSIFLNPETHQLFGYVEIEDESRWQAIAQTPTTPQSPRPYERCSTSTNNSTRGSRPSPLVLPC